MLTQSRKLNCLLRILWQNPVFGDSFPKKGLESSVPEQFQTIYPSFIETLSPILQKGIPETPNAVNETIAQIAPKSIAFCASISAGEIENPEYLSKAAAAISISYWADQSMDRDDKAMLAAVQYLNHRNVSGEMPEAENFLARLEALRHIRRLAQEITPLNEDLPYVLQAIERDVLGNQASMRNLSQKFIKKPAEDFWLMHAQEVAQVMIDGSGLMSAVAVIYAIYRRYRTELPSLDEIYAQPTLMKLVRETFNPAVRIFDDVGDSRTDTGEDANWGVFNLNIINQAHPRLIDVFLNASGIPDGHPLREKSLAAFARPLTERRITLAEIYLDLARQRVANLPAPLWKRYEVFLKLCKRTLEAGFVNILGDVFLSETTPLSDFDAQSLKLVTSDQRLSSWQEVTPCR